MTRTTAFLILVLGLTAVFTILGALAYFAQPKPQPSLAYCWAGKYDIGYPCRENFLWSADL